VAPGNINNDFTHIGEANLSALPITLVWISFAYSGWNAAIYLGGEIIDPQRNLQRALILATLCVTIIYLALNTLFLYSTPVEKTAGKVEIAVIVAEALGGSILGRCVSALVGLALFTSILSMIMASSRVYVSMAENNALPRLFSLRSDVPSAAVILQVALALLVVWISDLVQLLGYIGFTLGLSAAATVSAL